jgi:hypothetical protein
MITAILNVDSVKSSGKITFDALTDGSANEVVSTSLQDQKFWTQVQGNGDISGTISHSKSGLQVVVLLAETSKVSSRPEELDL